MEVLWRPARIGLGAEELLELGRPVRMYRYTHTPYLAGRRSIPVVPAAAPLMGNLFRPTRNLLGQAPAPTTPPPAAQGTSTMTKVLVIGIPVVFLIGVLALT